MFIRTQSNGSRTYLLIVDNKRVDGKVMQRVLFRLGRLDELLASGQLDSLIQSLGRFSEKLSVLGAHAQGDSIVTRSARIGPALIFERLWQACSIDKVLTVLLQDRRFEFSVERAIFLTVLHRLFAPGSDRAAEKWKDDYEIEGGADLELHHLYRAMAWQGAFTSHEPSRLYTPGEPFRARWTAEKSGAQAAKPPLPVEGVRAVVPSAAGTRALLQPSVPAGSEQVVTVEGAAEIPGDGGGPGEAQRAEPALSGMGFEPHPGNTGRVASGGLEGNHSNFFGHSCDRPGCYNCFVRARRSPAQRFCSRACRRAMERVWQRERRWRRAFEQQRKR